MKFKIPFSSEEEEIQMAPMIDMVFLLLIFFMAASHLSQLDRPEVEIPVADQSAVSRELAGRRTITLKQDGSIYLGNRPSALEDVGPAVEKARRDVPDVKIVIRADKRLKHREVRDLMQICAEAGAGEVIFATYEGE